MIVEVDVEGYAAEKQLREFSKLPIVEQKRIRAERKKKKKERLAILAKINEYQTQLCDKCKGKPDTHRCDCTASKAIQELGKRLGGEVVVGRPKRTPMDDFQHITPETFNKQVYLDMKDADLTDRNVLSLLGWYPNRLNKWKRENGLLGKKNPQKKRQPQKEIKGLTVEAYLVYKRDKQSDRSIGDKYGIASSALWAWKKDNGLLDAVKPQQAAQQPKGEKMMNDAVKLQEPMEVDYKAKYEAMKEQNMKHVEKSKNAQITIDKQNSELEDLRKSVIDAGDIIKSKREEIVRMANEISELKRSLSDQPSNTTDLQNEIYSLTTELNRLKNYERDYLNLEIDYRNERTENERLKLMLDRLKHTAQINVWLMEQHVGFHKQLDEVMG